MQPLLHELLLDYARQRNESHVKKVQVETQLRPVNPHTSDLRKRILLSLSDALLTAGHRIRPKEATQCC
jgi:hypothetical protein